MSSQFAQIRSFFGFVGNTASNVKFAGKVLSRFGVASTVTPKENEHLIAASQAFDVGARVELFVIDTTMLVDSFGNAGPLLYVAPTSNNSNGGVPIVWQGISYTPIAMVAEGFELSGTAAPATPKIRISNVGNMMGALVIEFGDLVGAIVYRYRTFSQFLDGQPNAHADAYFQPDVYTVQRKSMHNKMLVEWELSAVIDQENVYIPGRPVLKYTCTQTYRFWDPTLNGGAGGFNYTQASCPFNGSQNGQRMYTSDGIGTKDPIKDVCGRLESDCALRFVNEPLQTWAFPGVGATTSS